MQRSARAEGKEAVVWTGTHTDGSKGNARMQDRIHLQLRESEIEAPEAAAAKICRAHSLEDHRCKDVKSQLQSAADEHSGSEDDYDLVFEHETEEVVLVTAASHHFFEALQNLVGSVHFWEEDMRVVVYDLGLTPTERATVRSWARVGLRTLDRSKYPAHVFDEPYIYAWKLAVIADALERHTKVLYQDAGQELRQPLWSVKELMETEGHFFASAAGVPATTLAHISTMKQLIGARDLDSTALMILGGSLGITQDSKAHHEVIHPALKCALDRACIAPEGSSVKNHCFDQTVLSLVVARTKIKTQNEWRFHASDEAFHQEHLQHKLSLKHAKGIKKRVHPGEIVLYSRRHELPRPFLDHVRLKC